MIYTKHNDGLLDKKCLIDERDKMKEHKIKKAIDGNQDALCDLLLSMRVQLNKIGYGYFRQNDLIDEALSRTTLKAIENISSLREPKYFKTWIVRIYMNNCLDILKELNRFVEFEENDSLTYDPKDFSNLYEAIAHLPSNLQTLINLRFFNDYTFQEISDITALSEPTVRRRIKQGLSLLKLELGDDNRV